MTPIIIWNKIQINLGEKIITPQRNIGHDEGITCETYITFDLQLVVIGMIILCAIIFLKNVQWQQ